MPNIVNMNYNQTGDSTEINSFGMRVMQARAYEARNSQYLLLKSPPASGKSRALMFLALDKLKNQGIEKVIVAVPERSIGGSFSETKLTDYGFFADWQPNDRYNLCTVGDDGSKSKVKSFHNFMKSDEQILICTHATLRFAYEGLDEKIFDNSLVAIDEFHHVSADVNNRLGDLLRSIIKKSTSHIIAMTGSYFRGDSVPILLPEDEAKFSKVTYNYYEQLNGYKHLKSLGIGYHFYQGKYTEAIMEVLDTDKKTILHIPNVNSGESTKEKDDEVGFILDEIGDRIKQDSKTGVMFLKRYSDGKTIKVANLVDDTSVKRNKIVNYLRNMDSVDDIDLIIALGMAKEGFDWPYCEHALTVGYRGSLTEVIQIIGRATRDSDNKTHAQFTNLIAEPEAVKDEVQTSVNNMLKAITASLLMEQVLAPNFKFKTKFTDDDDDKPDVFVINGYKPPTSSRVKKILEQDINDLKANILQDDTVIKAIQNNSDAEVLNKVYIKNIIEKKYPDLTEKEIEEVRQYILLDFIIKNKKININDLKKTIKNDKKIIEAVSKKMPKEKIKKDLIPIVIKQHYPDLTDEQLKSCSNIVVSIPNAKNGKNPADNRFIILADKFINIDELHIDLIDQINPFQKAYEVLSKSVTPKVLNVIQNSIRSTRIKMDFEEARILWPQIQEFVKTNERNPKLDTENLKEKRLAECIIYLTEEKRKMEAVNG